MPQSHLEMVITSDDLGRSVRHAARPRRIVSLCPSQTETLFALGMGGQLVGRTRYCIHPAAGVRRITEVGGTKQLRLDAIRALQPDLVIAEKEENRREDVIELQRAYPVYVTDVRDVAGALRMIHSLGRICGAADAGERLAAQVEARWQRLQPLTPSRRAAYLVWRKPWMAAGGDTYINDVLARCGFRNAFATRSGRYPETTPEEIKQLAPDVVLLSSEPYPFKENHVREFANCLPQGKVLLVDGEASSWYGARMLPAADALQSLIDGLQ
jgi:ABC-type Fe3+-hydroxamate transport system substrate-binding protein